MKDSRTAIGDNAVFGIERWYYLSCWKYFGDGVALDERCLLVRMGAVLWFYVIIPNLPALLCAPSLVLTHTCARKVLLSFIISSAKCGRNQSTRSFLGFPVLNVGDNRRTYMPSIEV
jgi:hypothetical protein